MDTTTVPVVEETGTKPGTKVCKYCHISKPLKEYGKHPSTSDGLLTVCRTCMREAHSKPFRKIKEAIAAGTYVPTGYGGTAFERHAMEAVKNEQQQNRPITVHVGHGVIEQRSKKQETPREVEEMVVNAVEVPEYTHEPMNGPTRLSALQSLKKTSLEAWMVEDNSRSHAEEFLVEEPPMLIVRSEGVYAVHTLDGSAPTGHVPPEFLLWHLRMQAGLPADQDILGYRFY